MAAFVTVGQVWLMQAADLSAAGTSLLVTGAIATPFVFALLIEAPPPASRRLARAAFVAGSWLWVAGVMLLHLVAVAGIQLWGMIPTASIVSSYLQDSESLRDVWSEQGTAYLAAAAAAFLLTAFLIANRLLDEARDAIRLLIPHAARRLHVRPALVHALALTLLILPTALLWRVTHDGSQPNVASVLMETSIQPRSNLDLPDSSESTLTFGALQTAETSAGRSPDTILLIVVDALRADRVSPGPLADEVTPNLQGLLRSGGRYFSLRSACAESVCGLTSLFSGREPHRMVRGQETLTDVLRAKGFVTYAFLSGAHSNYYGLDERVGRFDVYFDDLNRPAKSLNDDADLVEFALRRLRDERQNTSTQRPRFLYFHLMSAHGVARVEERFKQRTPSMNRYHALFLGTRDPASLVAVKNGYDNGVAQADFYAYHLIRSLRDLGLLSERSLIIVTADHGESLGEDGQFAHGRVLTDSMLEIPLVWFGPTCRELQFGLRVQAEIAQCIARVVGLDVKPDLKPGPLTVHIQDAFAALIADEGTTVKRWLLDRRSGRIEFALRANSRTVERYSFLPGSRDYRRTMCEFDARGLGLRYTPVRDAAIACRLD